jgi:hypothetical protein
VKMFFGQVERNYDNILGFEKRTQDMKEEINNLHLQRLSQLNILSALPFVGNALARLLGHGLREDQIVKLANLVDKHPEICQSNGSSEGKQQGITQLSPSSSASAYSSSLQSASSHYPSSLSSSPSDDAATKKNIQSMTQSKKLHSKVMYDSQGEDPHSPTQGESKFQDSDSQPADTTECKDNLQNRDLVNPYLDQINYSSKDDNILLPNENISTLKKGAQFDAPRNSALLRPDNIQEEEPVGNQIETLPIGSMATSGWSNKRRGSWIFLDLDSIKKIQGIKIAWYRGDLVGYNCKISLSNDCIKFTEIRTDCSGGCSSSIQQVLFKEEHRARYMMITVDENNSSDMAGIKQVEILGSNV